MNAADEEREIMHAGDPLPDNVANRKAVESHLLVETELQSRPMQRADLDARMDFYKVPGVSIAVIQDYRVEWARGYGVREAGTTLPVTAETLFQACSISKCVAAATALRLVEAGRLDLDEDVNRYLTSWKVPANGSWQPHLTLRQILSHTGGVNVHGAPGYAPGQPIPTLLQVLNGEPPAITPAVMVNGLPGTQYRYSGGGYCILQQMLTDVTAVPFPALARELIFEPLGMTRSAFENPLPTALWDNAASGHNTLADTVNADKWQVYPEMAVGGLWTTAAELARFVLELQEARAGRSTRLLSAETVHQMLTSHASDYNVGLGLYLFGAGAARYFSHTGAHLGWKNVMLGYADNGQGAVVLTNNGYSGSYLYQEILRAIASVYAWPEYLPKAKLAVAIDAARLGAYVGEYELPSGVRIQVTLQGDRLYLTASGQPPIEMLAENESTFFAGEVNVEVTFERDEAGACSLKLMQHGRVSSGARIS